MNIQCAEQNFEFWEGTHQIKRVWPPPGTNHSTPLKAALPSDPPFTVYLPTNEKLYLVWVYSSNCCSEEYTLCENCLFRPKREEYIMPCFFVCFFGSFQRKCLPSFSVLFVLSSTCLIVRTKRIVELMNVLCCYYLLACACMDLLFLCLGGKRDGGTETLV